MKRYERPAEGNDSARRGNRGLSPIFAYAQQEAKEPIRKATREKIAEALGIAAEQLAV